MAVKKVPLRQCTGCREMKDKKQMMRVIRTPEGAIELDTTGRKNGRGAYVCNNAECLRKAFKTKALDRSLKTAIPEDVSQILIKEIEQVNG